MKERLLEARRFVEDLFEEISVENVGVRLWDGTLIPDGEPRPLNLILKHADSLAAMFQDGTEISLAESYLNDDFDIEGDISAIFDMRESLLAATSNWTRKLRVIRLLKRFPGSTSSIKWRGPASLSGKKHSKERDKQAISYHYDLSNDFYSLWLDQNMVYSCGYFANAEDDIDKAQERKMDYICRKLFLKPGQHFLDIGCGWGSLVIFAAKHYGVYANGVTLSEKQAGLANEKIEAAGLANMAKVHIMDYRDINIPGGTNGYDAITSVGMCEHVGSSNLPGYFSKALELLKPGGLFLNHGISRNVDKFLDDEGPGFVGKYVFPDGELIPIGQMLDFAERSGFEVRDVESLREHYALTLQSWVNRLESSYEKALRYVDESTYRVWRLYLSVASGLFVRGHTNVYQSLLVKPDSQGQSGMPLTRNSLYQKR